MFCPECGNEIPDSARFCPLCGADLTLGSTAPDAGNAIHDDDFSADRDTADESSNEQATVQDEPASARTEHPVHRQETPRSEPVPAPTVTVTAQSSPADASPDGREKKKKLLPIVLVLAVAAAALLVAVFVLPRLDVQPSRDDDSQEKPVDPDDPIGKTVGIPLSLNAPGYQLGTDTPIPLHISGKSLDGKSVEEDHFIGSDTDTLSIGPGSYTVTVFASPILSDGTIYVTDDANIHVDINDQDQVTTPTDQLEIDLPVATGDQMTDERIDAAQKAALASGTSEDSVNALVDKVHNRRSELTTATISYTTKSLSAGDTTFTYLQFSSSNDDGSFDELNKQMLQNAQDAANNAATDDLMGREAYVAYDQRVTFFQDGVICIVEDAIKTSGGVGWRQEVPYFVWTSGVTPGDVIPLLYTGDKPSDNPAKLNSLCADALSRYLGSGQVPNPDMARNSDLGSAAGNPDKVASDVANEQLTYYVTPTGYQVFTGDYYIGSHADGNVSIPICQLDGSPISNPTYTDEIVSLGPTGTMVVRRY